MPHLLIDAGPGSGKTTTLLNAHNYLLSGNLPARKQTDEQYTILETIKSTMPPVLASEVVFACMTNAGKENIVSRLNSDTRAFTYNGLGASLLIRRHRHQSLDYKRGERLLEAVIGRSLSDMVWNERKTYYSALRYIKCLKEELLQPTIENIIFIQQKYGIESSPPENMEELGRVMQRMMTLDGTVEWIDQVWLALNAITSPVYKIGYVDEAQDLSSLKLLLMLRCCANLVFCGDPWQSINGFAGADYNSFNKLKKLSYQQLALKTCFRCPPNHIQHFNTVRPARIIPFKTVPVPDLTINIKDLGAFIKKNLADPKEHMLISRLNSILLRVGIQLTRQGVACHIVSGTKENSLEEILTNYIKQTFAKTLSQLCSIADADKQNASRLGFQAGQFVSDRSDCILELAKEPSVRTIPQLISYLQSLTQESTASVPLLTIHKSKGLEANFVYILYPPIKLKPENQDQIEQEINLEFVSESRSKHQKIYVTQ